MGLFSKAPVQVRERIAKRAALVPTHEIIEWLEQSVSATGVQMRAYTRERSTTALEEAIISAETSLSLLRVLKERDDNTKG